MKNEGKLQTCIAIMAALAIMMLGTSQDSTTLPAVGLLVAFASLVFTDLLGWFSLHPYVAGAAGVVAGGNAFVQSQAGGLDSQFLAVANLLIHLQIILLFQKKSRRINWQLITLSLLQVVVAAALNLFVLFGPLLVMYTCVAIVAMLLFFQWRQLETFTDPSAQATSNADNSVSVLAMQPITANAELTSRQPKQKRTSFGKTAFFWEFFQLGVSTIVVSAAVFLLMPRFGNEVWRAKSKSVTGLSDEDVNLDSVSSIYEDPTIVMRVSFFREGTNEQYSLSSYPYLRSTVRDVYKRGTWSRSYEQELDAQMMSPLMTPTRVYSAVRQKVNLESKGGPMVCAVAPPCGLHDATDSMRVCPRTLEVKHFVQSNEDPLEFSIGTLGYRNGLQSEFLPAYTFDALWHADRGRYVKEKLPDLAATAAEVVKDIPEEQVLERARVLERYFRNGSAGYKYSLDPSPDRDVRRDPVEDFVMNHKTGHCQFFASALTLMLRSQGIPARYVSGFRADSYNVVGGYYQLRAMDAHAWVEAKIPADQVPSDEIMPSEGLRGGEAGEGAWVRLDPTPSGDFAASSLAVSPWRQKFNDSVDYMQLLWSEYVLGLNEKRQRKAIYEPILNALKNTYALAFSREVWAARMEAIRKRFEGDFFRRENMRDAGLAIVVLTIAFYVLRFLTRRLWSWISNSWGRSKRDRRPRVEFYRRFEKILAKHGIHRESGQTPNEFAAVVETQIAERTGDATLAEIPRQVVDLFYRVRFGGARLDSTDLQRLENGLGSLQNSLA